MYVDIRSPQFWTDLWEAHLKGDTAAISKGYSTPEFWDGRAEDYYHGHEEEGRKEARDTADMFEKDGCLFEGAEVLDIGCGTGTLTFELAGSGARVTSLDFSRGMLDRLVKEMPQGLEERITVVQSSWDDIDLKERGWEKRFDLVISNMSPAIHNSASLMKMIEASRKSCFLNAWVTKKRHSEVQEHIWKLLSGTNLEDRHAPFPYMLNLILALGYYPDMRYQEVEWKTSESLDKARDEHVQYFSSIFGEKAENIEGKISGYLQSIARDGMIDERVTGMKGSLFWHIA